jgi:cytochrome c-type biogenesis protein CcmH
VIRRLLFLLVLLASPALAVSDPGEMLRDPAQEARARDLGQQLRCLVCQNNSVEESESDFARDMRKVIRERVSAGDNDDAVMAWMTQRYGEFVRLNPRLSPLTAFLWATPALALLVGFGAVFLSRRRATAPPAPLTADEAEAVRKLSDHP